MTIEEYKLMEHQAMGALQRLRENGIGGDDIGILMSREVYEMAKSEGNPAYAVSLQDFHEVYCGYDIYVINEDASRLFSPTLIRFSENCDLHKLDAGTFLISESDDGAFYVYARSQLEPAFFCEAGLTVHQARRTEQMASTDRIRVRYEARNMSTFDWTQYVPAPTVEELRQELNEALSWTQEPLWIKPKTKKPLQKMKVPPVKDWDERIAPEDTKELDEFLSSLMRKDTLKPAT